MTGIVDFRVQPPFKSFLGLYFFRPRPTLDDPTNRDSLAVGRGPNRSLEERSMSRFIEELDAAEIVHAVIVGQRAGSRYGAIDNADIAELMRAYPGRFTGFAGIDATEGDAPAQARRAVQELGCRGISVVPGWSEPPLRDDDPALMRVYETCAALDALVVITSSHYIGPDMDHARPVHIQRAALAFPEVTFIVGHACWPWTTQAVALAMRCPNVYLMPEFYWYLPGMPGAGDYVDAANTFLRPRVLFSSCYPSRTVSEAVAHARDLPLASESVEPVFAGNARRLLALP
jgi:predicted TIM-barrel fold metal-dependent hydrolase